MSLIDDLKQMKFTESEAKVYTTLLKHGKCTGYEISKHSGVPRSKIYNHIEVLLSRGVLESFNTGKSIFYKAISPKELVDLTRKSMNNTLKSFEYLASNITSPVENEGIWELQEYDRVLLKSQSIIQEAQKSLYIQIWTNELNPELTEIINSKIDKIEKSIVILYDEKQKYDTGLKKFYPHGFEMERLEDMAHRWITIVSDDEIFLHAGVLFNNEVSAIYTKNKILSYFAKEYVQHDAYCIKLIDKFHDEILEVYGEGMSGVRDIFN
ncbi:transcriptional regulator, TrmB family [Gottschalkia acidurici 9a]|uniref:Transcriptional regulator, TrmB family n=1 Tax=Gottschalkia acidurici (strain ATCC 7906 / DSM 604 / BCRC 14475 / CIP 104303 / KCTC 5404 / NCIMB 10678 / 9a) TaxID=1128398 RepID=K0B3U5_GOTA9|nr:helix-turn-helix domain-containing protein [Gottschalkia acidurici]AFS79807.1 transcriptional regulator, TrmB family [Gottschalkia acidurici 9a]